MTKAAAVMDDDKYVNNQLTVVVTKTATATHGDKRSTLSGDKSSTQS